MGWNEGSEILILSGTLKNLIFREGFAKNQYNGRNYLKIGGLAQFVDLRGESAEKNG